MSKNINSPPTRAFNKALAKRLLSGTFPISPEVSARREGSSSAGMLSRVYPLVGLLLLFMTKIIVWLWPIF